MTHDVVIAGAGPVGLFLSIELATAGVKPLVLERLTEPDRAIKAAALGAVAVEALERRGLGPALEEESRAALAAMVPMLKARFGFAALKKPGGHFSGLSILDQSLQRDPERCMRTVTQETLEKILNARVSELGIEVRRGTRVDGFDQDDDGVSVQTSAGPLREKYLVGCDGTGVGIRYDLGDEEPSVGTLVKNQLLTLADGSQQLLYTLMQKGGGLLVSPAERCVPLNVRHAQTQHGPSMLLRPDGCIAWTAASAQPLDDAFARWF